MLGLHLRLPCDPARGRRRPASRSCRTELRRRPASSRPPRAACAMAPTAAKRPGHRARGGCTGRPSGAEAAAASGRARAGRPCDLLVLRVRQRAWQATSAPVGFPTSHPHPVTRGRQAATARPGTGTRRRRGRSGSPCSCRWRGAGRARAGGGDAAPPPPPPPPVVESRRRRRRCGFRVGRGRAAARASVTEPASGRGVRLSPGGGDGGGGGVSVESDRKARRAASARPVRGSGRWAGGGRVARRGVGGGAGGPAGRGAGPPPLRRAVCVCVEGVRVWPVGAPGARAASFQAGPCA